MTERNPENISFSSLGRKRFLADFNGGKITSDTGALLLRQVDKRIGLINEISNCIPDPRNPIFTKHDQRAMLAQRIYAIAMGDKDLNDHQSLRNYPVMQIITEQNREQEKPLASAPKLCRLENRIEHKSLVKIAEVLVKQFIASNKQPPVQLILDFYPTDDEIHGNQQGLFFYGYFDHYCF